MWWEDEVGVEGGKGVSEVGVGVVVEEGSEEDSERMGTS